MPLKKCSSCVSLLPSLDPLLLRLETVFKASFSWPHLGKQLPSALLPDTLQRHWMSKGPETHPGVQGSPEFERRHGGDTGDDRQTGLQGRQKTRLLVLLVCYFPSPFVFPFFFKHQFPFVTCFILLRKKKKKIDHPWSGQDNKEWERKKGGDGGKLEIFLRGAVARLCLPPPTNHLSPLHSIRIKHLLTKETSKVTVLTHQIVFIAVESRMSHIIFCTSLYWYIWSIVNIKTKYPWKRIWIFNKLWAQ